MSETQEREHTPLHKRTLTRRSFVKVAAVTGVVAATMGTSPVQALAADVATAGTSSDGTVKRIRTACRGCGKMECGVWVTVRDGRAIKIEGDDSAFQSNGNCCSKSQASIQAAYHPDRLHYPMVRTTAKGEDDPGWKRVTYDEAIEAVAKGLSQAATKYGNTATNTLMGTSRMWANASSRAFRDVTDGLNCCAANQVCKGPRREAGALTIENGIFWQANVDYPRVYVQWGTDQTLSNYDDACRVINECAQRAEIFISVDPRISAVGKEAQYHLPLRPGTDHALALGWTNIVIDRELYDDYLVKYWSNAPFLYCEEVELSGWTNVKGNISESFPVKTRLLKESDLVEGGSVHKFALWNNAKDAITFFDADENGARAGLFDEQAQHIIPTTGWEFERGGWVPDYPEMPADLDPAIWCEDKDGFAVTLKDGKQVKCKTVWQKYWDECVSEFTLAHTAEVCDLTEKQIEDACLAWATRLDDRVGNGGLNAQLAPEQTGRSIQTFRAIYLLFFMCDCYDIPGGNRGMTRNTCRSSFPPYTVSKTSTNASLSFVATDALTEGESEWDKRAKIAGADKFPMTRWWNGWVDCASVWNTSHSGDPYPIVAGSCVGGDFMNMSNASYAWEAWKNYEFTVTADLWHVPASRVSDVLLPVNHWLEATGWLRQSQGSSGAIGCNRKCIELPGEVLYEPDMCNLLYKATGREFFNPKEGDPWNRPFTDVLDKNCKAVGIGYDTWEEFQAAFQEHGWWQAKELYPEDWGTYRRYLMGYLRNGRGGNAAKKFDGIPGTGLPTMKIEFWSTILESYIADQKQEMPKWQESPLSPVSTPELFKEYPFNMTTGRRIPVYFHNEHRQLPWCRELWPAPRIEIHPNDAAALGLEQGDWCWIESKWGKIRQIVDLYHGIKPGIVNCEHQWWFPETEDSTKGFDLCSVNVLNDKDAQCPICGASQLRAIPVKIYKATPENCPGGNVIPTDHTGIEIIHDASDPRLAEWVPTYEGRA